MVANEKLSLGFHEFHNQNRDNRGGTPIWKVGSS